MSVCGCAVESKKTSPIPIARPLRPALPAARRAAPTGRRILYGRLEDVDFLRAALSAGRKVVHAARLVEHQGDVEVVAALVRRRERRRHAVVIRNQAGRRVTGVLRHLRALGQRRGHDVRRHPVGGNVLRAGEAHVDLLLDSERARAEVGPEVRLPARR